MIRIKLFQIEKELIYKYLIKTYKSIKIIHNLPPIQNQSFTIPNKYLNFNLNSPQNPPY